VSLDQDLFDASSEPTVEFRVWVDHESGPPCVGVAGEIDLLTCAPFRHALADACANGSRRIALDLAAVTFLGSTGLREIARLLPIVDSIEIRSPSRFVRHVLETVQLGQQVTITD
jgi:anti-anti-sigma factor